MRSILYALLMAASALVQAQPATHEVSVVSCNFTLYGKTNVNTFKCILEQTYPSGDPVIVKSVWANNQITFNGLTLKFPLDYFDCGLEAMSKDLRETLKSEEYPYLYLRINSIQLKQEKQEMERLNVISSVTITLGGVSRNMVISNGTVINHTQEQLTLTGSKLLDMTDFNINPPVKFFGMVKVESELNVAFEIQMKALPLK